MAKYVANFHGAEKSKAHEDYRVDVMNNEQELHAFIGVEKLVSSLQLVIRGGKWDLNLTNQIKPNFGF